MQHREKIATEESYKRLLESLYFPDMHAREEGIDEAHKHTFEWIFDEPGNEVRPWHHFIGWLKEGHGTYWISGKAGSGKSTLMNFVCHDPRTEAALKIWSGTNKIFTPTFFFWSPGSQLQKSLAGLLRSLIYQILERFPDLMPVLAESTGPFQHGLCQVPTWTEQRLRATLQNLLCVESEKCHFCIFIDGLDEFHGDHVTLLNLISVLRKITKVKFCLSSRPYPPFKHELGSSPMLKLQDLTEPDIRKYVSDNLEGTPLKASWVPYPSSRIKEAVHTIVQKAEGVFLWVRLAVRDQLEGIRNGDDTDQLRERLQILPTEVEGVYAHMLHRIDKVYRKEVAQHIRLVIDVKHGWSLFEIALAEHKRIDDILLFSEEISTWDLSQHCKSVGERIAATCKGFLEIRDVKVDEEVQRDNAARFSQILEDQNIPLEQREELRELELLNEYTRVEFLHRTAFDFFNDNEQGKEFLKIHTTANTHPQVLYVKSLLADFRIFPVATDNSVVQGSIRSIMWNAFFTEQATGVAQLALMDLIDRSITLLWKHTPGQPANLQWYSVWGNPLVHLAWEDGGLKRNKVFPGKSPIKHGLSTIQPVEFLGLTAWYGLNKYVQQMLDLHSRKWESDTVGYLLGCSVCGLGDNTAADSHLELIPALLKQGADSNKKILESTVWGSFLQGLFYGRFHFNKVLWGLKKRNWSNTVKVFLESGANVHENFYTDFSSFNAELEFSLSPRCILQWCLAKEPDFFDVENLLVASGAKLYSECTSVLFKVTKGGVEKWIDLKPSEQQSNQLAKMFEQGPPQDKMLKRQVVEIFQNADMDQLYDQAPTDDESESELSQEEGSQEYQSGTNTKWTNSPSSIDAPASPTDEAEGSFYSAHSSQQEEED